MSIMQTHLTISRQHSDLTDDILVRQAHIGDPGAFEILCERYSALLFLLISRMVRDEHLAYDVLQHVFIQLYRSLPTLEKSGEKGGTLKAWLSQVARHRSIDELRRKRPILFSEIALVPDRDEFSPLTTLLDPDRQPEEQVELRELRVLLLEAIETLPSRYRAVVLLRYTDQLSYREIGQALSMPESTAKMYFSRASKQLRSLLGSEFAYYRGKRGSESLQHAMQYIFLPSYLTHCDQELHLEYHSKGQFVVSIFIPLLLIFVGTLWYHDVWFPPEGRVYKKKRDHNHDRV
jgi:RNA polymerase sigma-70 factor, ECF subfamily